MSAALLYEIRCLPRLMVNKRLKYSQVTFAQFQQIMNFLLRHIDEKKPRFDLLSRHTNVSTKTLSKWRDKLKENPRYNPKIEYDLLHRAMSPKLEEQIINEIEENFLRPGFYFNNFILKMIAKAAFDSAPDEDRYRADFKASTTWCKAFRQRHGYVWRKPHYKRRPVITEKGQKALEDFNNRVSSIYEMLKSKDQLYLLCNADETAWKICYLGQLTWAKSGSKEVKVHVKHNTKECFTTIATITASSQYYKLPLFLISKGKTERSRLQFGNFMQKYPSCGIFQSINGWSTKDVMINYLNWLRKTYDETFADCEGYEKGKTTIYLIWDCHASHRHEEVRSVARALSIELIFVPPGRTDEAQPLDLRVFGALKASARAFWLKVLYYDKEATPTKAEAANVLATCWEQLSDDVFEDAWELYSKANYTERVENDVVEIDDEQPDEFHDRITRTIQAASPCDYLDSTNEEECENEDSEESGTELSGETSKPVNDDEMSEAEDNGENDAKEDDKIEEEEMEEGHEDRLGYAGVDWEEEAVPLVSHIQENYTPLDEQEEDFEEESDSDVESYEENNVELTKEHNSHEDELLSIKLAISKKSEVKLYNGIRNIGRSCYFNVIVQLLVYLPNLESYILSEDEILPSQKEFYSFLLRIISQVKCSTSTVSISNTLLTPNIRSCISSPYGGAPTALLWDILNPTSVAVKQNGKENLFVTIDPKHSFAENIKSIFPESIKNILFVYRDTDVDGSKFMFPDSFRYQTHNMVLRFIITHPHDHFVGYLKLYTGTFIEFNDSRVSEVSEINPFETLLALYIRS